MFSSFDIALQEYYKLVFFLPEGNGIATQNRSLWYRTVEPQNHLVKFQMPRDHRARRSLLTSHLPYFWLSLFVCGWRVGLRLWSLKDQRSKINSPSHLQWMMVAYCSNSGSDRNFIRNRRRPTNELWLTRTPESHWNQEKQSYHMFGWKHQSAREEY